MPRPDNQPADTPDAAPSRDDAPSSSPQSERTDGAEVAPGAASAVPTPEADKDTYD